MIRFIQSVSNSRWCWVALFVLGLVLEGCGLYFQYGLRLEPCVNCVYERALYLSFILAGLIGMLSPSFFLTRVLAELVFMAGSAGGVMVAITHIRDVEQSAASIFGSVCQLKADFPDFLPLDEWLPWMFRPTGGCVPLDWSLLGFGMPQWVLFSFACGLAVSICFFLTEFCRRKHRDFDRYYR